MSVKKSVIEEELMRGITIAYAVFTYYVSIFNWIKK
jgi:hypothetical protein